LDDVLDERAVAEKASLLVETAVSFDRTGNDEMFRSALGDSYSAIDRLPEDQRDAAYAQVARKLRRETDRPDHVRMIAEGIGEGEHREGALRDAAESLAAQQRGDEVIEVLGEMSDNAKREEALVGVVNAHLESGGDEEGAQSYADRIENAKLRAVALDRVAASFLKKGDQENYRRLSAMAESSRGSADQGEALSGLEYDEGEGEE
jgi:hypothetical protein